jgi:hypothetical protein
MHGMIVGLPAAVTAAHFSHVKAGPPCPVLVGMLDGLSTPVAAEGELPQVTESDRATLSRLAVCLGSTAF